MASRKVTATRLSNALDISRHILFRNSHDGHIVKSLPKCVFENLRNHGVSFEEAQAVFYDDFSRAFYDDEHSGG